MPEQYIERFTDHELEQWARGILNAEPRNQREDVLTVSTVRQIMEEFIAIRKELTTLRAFVDAHIEFHKGVVHDRFGPNSNY